jgi:hypothetical protein
MIDQRRLYKQIDLAFESQGKVPADIVTGLAWEDNDILYQVNIRGGLIDEDFVTYFFDSLSNFTKNGFRWVLPFYLKESIKNPAGDVADRLIGQLGLLRSEKNYYDFLSPLQKQVAVAVLQYLALDKENLGAYDRIDSAIKNLSDC